MNILFFARRFYPDIGGGETHVLEVSKRLVDLGNTVLVISEVSKSNKFDNSNYRSEEVYDGIKIIRANFGKDNFLKKFRIWYWMWQHKYLIANADIVHCHDVFFWYLPFRFLYPQKPVYITFHGYETVYPIAKNAIVIRKMSEKLAWGNICIGDFIKKWYGTKPTYTTYGGVEIPPSSHKTNRTNKTDRKIKIVFVGRLEPDNGVLEFLEALKILQEKGVDYTFIALGGGSLLGSVKRYGKAIGFVKDPISYIQNSDIVFASSYLSILLGFACRKPVFSVYTNPLKKDYLEMTPFADWIVESDDPESIAAAILSLETKNNSLEKAYAWVKKQTWDGVVNIYLALWKQNEEE